MENDLQLINAIEFEYDLTSRMSLLHRCYLSYVFSSLLLLKPDDLDWIAKATKKLTEEQQVIDPGEDFVNPEFMNAKFKQLELTDDDRAFLISNFKKMVTGKEEVQSK